MSRYDLFRKRIAPIAFFLAIALIARDTCQKEQRTHATVELQLAGDPRGVDVDVVVGGATVARYHKSALPDRPLGRVEFKLAIPAEDGELRIDVERGADHQRVVRHFHAIEDSTMLVTIAEDAR